MRPKKVTIEWNVGGLYTAHRDDGGPAIETVYRDHPGGNYVEKRWMQRGVEYREGGGFTRVGYFVHFVPTPPS
jgi:hypothetical protein